MINFALPVSMWCKSFLDCELKRWYLYSVSAWLCFQCNSLHVFSSPFFLVARSIRLKIDQLENFSILTKFQEDRCKITKQFWGVIFYTILYLLNFNCEWKNVSQLARTITACESLIGTCDFFDTWEQLFIFRAILWKLYCLFSQLSSFSKQLFGLCEHNRAMPFRLQLITTNFGLIIPRILFDLIHWLLKLQWNVTSMHVKNFKK